MVAVEHLHHLPFGKFSGNVQHTTTSVLAYPRWKRLLYTTFSTAWQSKTMGPGVAGKQLPIYVQGPGRWPKLVSMVSL
ncbi:MAG: hypothetical protein F4Y53_04945 [Proteobacteria bacterium]|nr:hypothetical protein [Pseudomonadota bacterium]